MGRAKKPRNIKLLIKGPRSLLKKNNSVVVETQSNRTWIRLLRDDLRVKVSPTSGFFVCSEHYSVTNPEIGKGWRSELSESVSEFVGKFKKRRELIGVRISNGKGAARLETSSNVPSINSTIKKRTKGKKVRRATLLNGNRKCQARSVGEDTGTSTLQLDPSPGLENSNKENMGAKKVGKKPNTPKQLRRMGNIFRTPQIDHVRSVVKTERRSTDNCDQSQKGNDDTNDEEEESRKQQSKENVYNGSGNNSDTSSDEDKSDNGQDNYDLENDYDDDLSSCLTAVTVENMELRQAGIPVEDVKSLVEGRIPRFSNAYLLRVKNEINKLQQNNVWDRNMNRAPLACYLLQELFK